MIAGTEKKLRRLFFLLLLLVSFSVTRALNVTIIEPGYGVPRMDSVWCEVARKMGHTPAILPQSALDNNAFFAGTDILIVSTAIFNFSTTRVNTIVWFIQSGKPVYLQSEYLPNFGGNQTFAAIVTALGGNFTWDKVVNGNLQPMNAVGDFANTPNVVPPLNYFYYGVTGKGNCNTIPFLEYNGNYFGYQYRPFNPFYGSVITTSDQDWVWNRTSLPLMENILTQLISPGNNKNSTVNLGKDTTLCSGDTLYIDTIAGVTSYLWQDGSTGSSYTIKQPGTYWLKARIGECDVADTIHVSYINKPNLNLGSDTALCTGDTLVLNASTPGATYLWQDSSSDPFYTVKTQGSYRVKVSVNNCAASDSITISYKLVPVINLGNDTSLCEGQALMLNGGVPGADYLWQDGSKNAAFLVSKAGQYRVEATVNGCTGIDSININYNKIPKVFLGNDTILCDGTRLTLNVDADSVTYLWQDNSTQSNIEITNSGIYWVKISNSCGDNKDTISITYINCDCNIFIPDAFTPNADKLNETFAPVSFCDFEKYYFVIFNRWGEKLFETFNPLQVWDGSYKGQKVYQGVYTYYVTYIFKGGVGVQTASGNVTLLD